MKLAIVTDAWEPQVNGVVTTLRRTRAALEALGHEVAVLSPDQHKTIPCPTYPEIRLALWPRRQLAASLDAFGPDAIHVATEGPLGLAAAKHCAERRLGIHDVVSHAVSAVRAQARARAGELDVCAAAPASRPRAAHARGHGASAARSRRARLRERRHLVARRRRRAVQAVRSRPSRFAAADLRLHGTHRRREESRRVSRSRFARHQGHDRRRPRSRRARVALSRCGFLGYRFGAELAACLSSCDVFVFPSRTDTFGLVMLEAMACGTPVAAYPVIGPADVVTPGVTGVLDEDLGAAALAALDHRPRRLPARRRRLHVAERERAVPVAPRACRRRPRLERGDTGGGFENPSPAG